MKQQSVPAEPGRSGNTAERLLLAAERLFATHGVDGVSLRQINAEAGQRNLSAAHYHFGSRQALIEAIYDYRMESVNRRRLAMLERLATQGRQHDLRSLAEAVVRPILDEIEESEGGSYYIRFLAQVMGHPQLSPAGLWRSRHAEGLGRIAGWLREARAELPAALVGQRFGLMWEQVIHALADREHLRESAPGISPKLFVENLIDVVTGGFAAPLSPATRNALGRARSRAIASVASKSRRR